MTKSLHRNMEGVDVKAYVIIPARFASSRFPGKPLIEIGGKSMIQRVVTQARKAHWVSKVIVATDDRRIFNHVQSFGGEVRMTAIDHQSGTDRCAEIVKKLELEGIIVNVQGDEPFIQPSQIDELIQHLHENTKLDIATLSLRINDEKKLFDPNIVKVVFGTQKNALYFSRHTIPFMRGVDRKDWLNQGTFYKHIGLYAYRSEVLLPLANLPKGELEQKESLEQLRWLENGYAIGVLETKVEAIGIDTPEDLEYVNELLEKGVLI